LKRAGLKIHQDKYDDGQDYLVYKRGQMEIPTETIDDIVALKTTPLDLSKDQREGLMVSINNVNLL
jgi:hypothetical protein